MESDLVSDESSFHRERVEEDHPLFSFTEVFNSHLPFYLSIGMTYEQFWDGDCDMVIYFRKAHELKQERENQMLWLQGMYVYEAICDCVPVLVTMPDKRAKIREYSKKPYPINQRMVEEDKQEKITEKRKGIQEQFKAFAKAYNQSREGENNARQFDSTDDNHSS